jgi:hypothetical protein
MIRRLQPPSVHLIPVEILSEIFLLAVQGGGVYQNNLMLVCSRWYATMLSTSGMHFGVRIRNSTKKEDIQAAMRGRRWLLHMTIDITTESIPSEFDADDFHACFMAAAQEASRWRTLHLSSLPPHNVCKPIQILQPLEHLESFVLDDGCDLGSFFEPLMTAITTTVTPRLTVMALCDLDAVLYLVQPSRIHIFYYLRILHIGLPKRMEGPMDILPHLQRLERFAACHLFLPVYPPDVHLPLIQTLSWLSLKSVSIQWMAGHTFPALKSCSIRFPHHANTIALQPVSVPSCTSFKYDSNDLGPLRYFHHALLCSLTVRTGQWSLWRANPQLISTSCMVMANAQSLTALYVHVQCSESLLVEMLKLVPALERLGLGLTSPHALSKKFFLQFMATGPSAGSSWRNLDLSYKRWLRGSERKEVIPVLGDIVASHQKGLFSLSLSCLEGSLWRVEAPVQRFCEVQSEYHVMIGISSPHAIVVLSSYKPKLGSCLVPFKEAEYLYVDYGQLSIDILFPLHCLVELRAHEHCNFTEPTALPVNLPFYHVLRVLEAEATHPSYLAGQTFSKLERCRVGLQTISPTLSSGVFTEMPICTRLDMRDLSLLATFKLPLVSELGVALDHPESNLIWEQDIAVNANLSGLRLLHVHNWCHEVDLIQILRSVLGLESLIVGNGENLDVDFFRALVPNQASAPSESNGLTQVPTVLCPMLESLQVEGTDPTEELQLMHIIEEVVMLRAVAGSPLKTFTFFEFMPQHQRKFEMIGGDGSLVMKKTLLDETAEPFELYI